jgi:primosomal protein N''
VWSPCAYRDKDFEEPYLNILASGLRLRKKSVLATIKEWNDDIFPGWNGGERRKAKNADYERAMAQLQEDRQSGPGGK